MDILFDFVDNYYLCALNKGKKDYENYNSSTKY